MNHRVERDKARKDVGEVIWAMLVVECWTLHLIQQVTDQEVDHVEDQL